MEHTDFGLIVDYSAVGGQLHCSTPTLPLHSHRDAGWLVEDDLQHSPSLKRSRLQ